MCAKDDCCPSTGRSGVEIACKCDTRIQRFLLPCLLLLLKIKPSYGYELVENLHQFGFDDLPDPATAYKNLRAMEQDGWVTSRWDTNGPGPARRMYSLNREGEDLIRSWAVAIRRTRQSLSTFLSLFEKEFKEDPKT